MRHLLNQSVGFKNIFSMEKIYIDNSLNSLNSTNSDSESDYLLVETPKGENCSQKYSKDVWVTCFVNSIQ